MPTEFFLLGAGGHGKVVLDALYAGGITVRVYDADPQKAGLRLLHNEVNLLPDDALGMPAHGHIAIGDNAVRRRAAAEISAAGSRLVAVLHPRAVVAASALVADGAFIAASVVVAPEAVVGEGTIVNHGAVVDHDCRIGRYCHIAPNATLGGQVVIGDEVLVGSGAVILPGIKVGDGACIGSGAVVTRDVAAGQIVVGIPARSRQ